MTCDMRVVLKVVACATGGRFSPEAAALVKELVGAKVEQAPGALRGSFCTIWRRRWWSLLSVAVQRAVGQNLLGADAFQVVVPAPQPGLEELLPPDRSRLM